MELDLLLRSCALSKHECTRIYIANWEMLLQDWQNHPDVLYARALVQKGQKVTSVTDGMPTWVCELMVVKPTIEEAITFVKAIDAALDIPIV